MGGVQLENLEVVRFYLFGDVKFLHLLLLLMGLDILTGILKAWKNQNVWERKNFFGYAGKLMILVAIILANVVDQILDMNGAITYATVLFYIANEGLSILENMAELGILVPPNLAKKLKVIDPNKKGCDEAKKETASSEEKNKNISKKTEENEEQDTKS